MNNIQTAWTGRYSSVPISDFLMYGLGLDGNKANNVVGVNDNYDHCLNALYSAKTYISACNFKNALRGGLTATTGANDSTFIGNIAQDCNETGIYAEVSSNISVIGNTVKNCSTVAYNIGAICFNYITGGVISGNNVSTGEDGIYIRNISTDIVVTGNTLVGQVRYGIWVYDESQTGGANAPTRISITGNTIKGSGNWPVYGLFAKNVIVSSNTIDCGASLPGGVFFNNNDSINISANSIINLSASVTTGTISAGSNSLTIASATWFPVAANGSYIYIANAGSGGNTPLFAQIVSGGGTTTLVLDRYAITTATGQAVTCLPVIRGAGNTNVRISDVSGTYSPLPYGQTTPGTFVGTSSGTWSMVGDRVLFTSVITQTTLTGAAGILQCSLPIQPTGAANENFPATVYNTAYTGGVTALNGYNTGAGYGPANCYYRVLVSNNGASSLLSAPTGTMTSYVSGQYQAA
jgi:parallel beta-helix repeat protein